MLSRRFDWLALCALTFICAVVFWPLLSGQSYYYGDLNLYFHPMATFWKSELAQGRVPLWNPGILGGTPFVGNPQMWVLYPSALLFLIFPAVTALALATWLHLWLGGALFYGWMRRGTLELRVLPSLLGACVWMLSGYVVAKTQFPNMLQALTWVPAVLWASEGVAARPNTRAALILGAVLGLQLLAAHAQISLFSLYMLMIYLPYRWIGAGKGEPRRVLFCTLGALILAGGLAFGQILPDIEAVGAMQRQVMSVQNASRFAVVPWAMITLILPNYYGNPMHGYWNYPFEILSWESVCYVGLVPLGLAAWSAAREPRARFWSGWSLGFWWISFGAVGGLYAVAFYVLPGLARFHDAGRFIVGFTVGIAVLAALGAGNLAKTRAGTRWVTLALLLTVVDLGIFARGTYPFRPIARVQSPPPALWGDDAMIEARQGRLWEPNFIGVWEDLQTAFDFHQGDEAHARLLFEAAPYNRHLMLGILAESGYEPLYDRAAARRVGGLGWRPNGSLPPDFAARLGRSRIRILQIFRAQPLASTPGLTLVYASPWNFKGKRLYYYRNEDCPPRAQFADENGKWQGARIVRETANRVELEVPSRARQIELADSARPGWRAFAGNEPLEIGVTSDGWRRVALPRAPENQTRRVSFVYAPTVWKLGVFVSLCALGGLCAGLVATRGRK